MSDDDKIAKPAPGFAETQTTYDGPASDEVELLRAAEADFAEGRSQSLDIFKADMHYFLERLQAKRSPTA
jgi:hypothetical protein